MAAEQPQSQSYLLFALDKPLHPQAPARRRLTQLFHHTVLHPTPHREAASMQQAPNKVCVEEAEWDCNPHAVTITPPLPLVS